MYEKILVPVDGSDPAAGGLAEAIKIAKSFGGRIRLVHVVNEFIIDATYGPGAYTNDILKSLRDIGAGILKDAEALVRKAGVAAESVLLESIGGPAAEPIAEQARQWPADLIVMGTHGRRGFARLALGSDAEEVVRIMPVPVLLVRAEKKSRP